MQKHERDQINASCQQYAQQQRAKRHQAEISEEKITSAARSSLAASLLPGTNIDPDHLACPDCDGTGQFMMVP